MLDKFWQNFVPIKLNFKFVVIMNQDVKPLLIINKIKGLAEAAGNWVRNLHFCL